MIAQALKDKIPLASPDPTSGTYDDLDSAAQGFYKSIGQHDPQTEQAGVIYSDPSGKYHYSIPSRQRDDGFSLRVQQTPEQKLAALFHSHPNAGQDPMVFSPPDVQTAQKLNVPSYIYFEKDGSMRKYIPGVTPIKTETVGTNLAAKVSKGEIVKQALIAQALRKNGA